MVKKNFLLVLYFLQFYLTSLWGKEYFPKLSRSRFFWPLGAGAARKKKYQEPEPLGKKSGAGAAWKKVRSRSRSHLNICQLPSPAYSNIFQIKPVFFFFKVDTFCIAFVVYTRRSRCPITFFLFPTNISSNEGKQVCCKIIFIHSLFIIWFFHIVGNSNKKCGHHEKSCELKQLLYGFTSLLVFSTHNKNSILPGEILV